MTKIERINSKIASLRQKQNKLENELKKNKRHIHNEIVHLEWSKELLPRKGVKFREEQRTTGRGLKKKTVTLTIKVWTEHFVDEDNGEIVSIERDMIVKRDGVQFDHLGRPITRFLI
jgi:hypothetical protein